MKDLSHFRNLILSVDGEITKYDGNGKENYTIWTPGGITGSLSDDTEEDIIQMVYVDRYTKIDNDPIVTDLFHLFNDNYIPYEYEVDYEKETGYIHHIFSCRVW